MSSPWQQSGAAPRPTWRAQRGLSLIETLAALVVLSVGLLGIAMLQTQGIEAGRTAHFRNQAVNLSADMAERIRSNPLGLEGYSGPGSDHGCSSVTGDGLGCTPAQMAAHDVFLWDRAVRSSLPNGEWQIQVDSGSNPASYRLAISWEEPRHGPLEHRLTIRALRR